MAAVFLCFTSW